VFYVNLIGSTSDIAAHVSCARVFLSQLSLIHGIFYMFIQFRPSVDSFCSEFPCLHSVTVYIGTCLTLFLITLTMFS